MANIKKPFEFIFPLIMLGGNPLGEIKITGVCYEEQGIAILESKNLDFSKGTTLNSFAKWLEHNSTEQIDDAIQQHIEFVLRGSEFIKNAYGDTLQVVNPAHTQIFGHPLS